MIDSYTATSVLVAFLIVFGIILPILDKVPKIKDFISFRWLLVVTYTAMCIGVILDFEHLDTSVRFAVVVGGIILASLFLLVRSIEKAALHKFVIPHFHGKLQKGDLSGELSVTSKLEEKNNSSKRFEELSNFVTSHECDDFDDIMNRALLSQDIKDNKNKEDRK